MTYEDPLLAIINKMRANTVLTSILAASRVHEGFPVDNPDLPGIYVTSGKSVMKQTCSSANQPYPVLNGSGKWYIDAFSEESVDDAETICRLAAETTLPYIPTAGLFTLNIDFVGSYRDSTFNCFRSTYALESPVREWVVGVPGSTGSGWVSIEIADMRKAVYDVNRDGIVDVTEGIREVSEFPSTPKKGDMVLKDGEIYVCTGTD
jgi:hypothetical protein